METELTYEDKSHKDCAKPSCFKTGHESLKAIKAERSQILQGRHKSEGEVESSQRYET